VIVVAVGTSPRFHVDAISEDEERQLLDWIRRHQTLDHAIAALLGALYDEEAA
jgi:hypothetical protein